MKMISDLAQFKQKQRYLSRNPSHSRHLAAASYCFPNHSKPPKMAASSSPPLPNPKERKPKKRSRRRRRPYAETNSSAAASSKETNGRRPNNAANSAAATGGKYWVQRYDLFSRYDHGILMDAEGWYSATPEAVAAAHAARVAPGDIVVDAFAGVGGNATQFAVRGCYVIAVEIDPKKVECAMNNARIYGVEDRIEFVVGDFFRLAPSLKGDIVFLSPPWGGPSYSQIPTFTLDMLKPKGGYAIFQVAQRIAPNIIMFLPRNVDMIQSEESCVRHRVKGITAYFGNFESAPSRF